MRVLRNTGDERPIDALRRLLTGGQGLDLASSEVSLFAFHELLDDLGRIDRTRLVVSADLDLTALLGDAADRPLRNRLLAPWLAMQCDAWLCDKVDTHCAPLGVPQGAAIVRRSSGEPQYSLLGAFSLTTTGLGLTPGNPLSLIQCSETADEAAAIADWFDTQWKSFADQPDGKQNLLSFCP